MMVDFLIFKLIVSRLTLVYSELLTAFRRCLKFTVPAFALMQLHD